MCRVVVSQRVVRTRSDKRCAANWELKERHKDAPLIVTVGNRFSYRNDPKLPRMIVHVSSLSALCSYSSILFSCPVTDAAAQTREAMDTVTAELCASVITHVHEWMEVFMHGTLGGTLMQYAHLTDIPLRADAHDNDDAESQNE